MLLANITLLAYIKYTTTGCTLYKYIYAMFCVCKLGKVSGPRGTVVNFFKSKFESKCSHVSVASSKNTKERAASMMQSF